MTFLRSPCYFFAGDYDWEQEHEKFSSFHKDVGENGNHDLNSGDQYGLHEVCVTVLIEE